MATFTRQEAEKRGWTFPTDEDGLVCAVAPDVRVVGRVGSDTPYFFAVEYAAKDEGEPFPEERNTATIKLVSGETYVDPPPEPPEPPVLTPEQDLASSLLAAKDATARDAALVAWAKKHAPEG